MGFLPNRFKQQELTEDQKNELRKKGFDRVIPYPVSNNQLHMQGRFGGIVLTPKTRAYYARVVELLRDNDVPQLTGRLCVELWIHDPDLRRRDINNYTKSLFDALEHAKVFVDDEQIDETHIYRCDPKRGGEVRVKIREIENPLKRLKVVEYEKEQEMKTRKTKRASLLKKRYGHDKARF